MKKLLVAVAMAAVATQASALISGSSHDFSSGWLNPQPSFSCKGCHVAHRSSNTNFLWARSDYTTVTISAFASTGAITFGPGVQTCMVCHGGNVTGLAKSLATNAVFGSDLRQEHPVGIGFVVPSGGGKWTTGLSLGGVPVVGVNVECVTCHTVHNATDKTTAVARYLLKNYTPANICVACHNY